MTSTAAHRALRGRSLGTLGAFPTQRGTHLSGLTPCKGNLMGPRPHQDIEAGFPRPDGRRLGISTRVPYTRRALGLHSLFSFSLFPLVTRPGPWAHSSKRSATSPALPSDFTRRSPQIGKSKKRRKGTHEKATTLLNPDHTTSVGIPCLLKLCLATVNKSSMLSPTSRNVVSMTSTCLPKQGCPSK